MKEIDFLPERFRRSAGQRRWRRHALAAAGLALLAAVCLQALHQLRVGLAAASAAIPEADAGRLTIQDGVRRIHWNLPLDRRTNDPAISGVIHAVAGAESESLLIEELDLRSETTLIEIVFHQDRQIGGTVDGRGHAPASIPGADPLDAAVTGYAEGQIDIGLLLGRLTACPYAEGPRIAETRRTQLNDRTMIEFRIVFTLLRHAAAGSAAAAGGPGNDGDPSRP